MTEEKIQTATQPASDEASSQPLSHTHDAAHGHVHGPHCNHSHEPRLPFVRAMPKVGRNDPCPCGSGLKAKKCCSKN